MLVCSQVQHLSTDSDVGTWLLFLQVGEEKHTHTHTHTHTRSFMLLARWHIRNLIQKILSKLFSEWVSVKEQCAHTHAHTRTHAHTHAHTHTHAHAASAPHLHHEQMTWSPVVVWSEETEPEPLEFFSLCHLKMSLSSLFCFVIKCEWLLCVCVCVCVCVCFTL